MRPQQHIGKQMEAWWAEHGGRHDHPEWIAYVNDFGTLLIDKLVEMSEEHDNAGRFGMSKAGGCTRAAGLKYLGFDSEPLSGSTRATFNIGHILEIKAIATLRAIGYEVSGMQQRITIDPYMASASDGIIVIDGKPHILSVKSMGYKMSGKRYGKGGITWTRHGFAAMVANGVRAEQPGHFAQSQAEMHAATIPDTLYLVVAKDMVKAMEADPLMVENGSLTFYTEGISYDPSFATSLDLMWGTQWAAVQGGRPGPAFYYANSGQWIELDPNDADGNKAATGTYDPCSYCDLRAACTVGAPLAASIHQQEVANV